MKTLAFILAVLMLAGCETVRFKQIALYDVYEEPVQEEKQDAIIFDEGQGTMWASLSPCGDFEVTKEDAYSGKTSIKLDWDKGRGCEWIGFGNTFSNWAAADMSEERFKKALSFYVRTQRKTAGGIALVAALEDFGGGGSYHFCDASKYLDGLVIDTTWSRMIVPLWDFPVREEEVDIYSIKQMKFQLEGAGAFYLDDIRLIDYTKEEYAAMRDRVEDLKPKGDPNQVVYREGRFLEDAWGYENNRCQKLEEQKGSDGSYSIYWKFDPKDCVWAKWGINWNGWYQVNFRGILDQATLKFKVKTDGKARFRIMLEDHRYHSTEIWTSKTGTANSWETVEIPLKDLKLKEKGFALDQIKQLLFEGQEAGTVQVDDIRIVGA